MVEDYQIGLQELNFDWLGKLWKERADQEGTPEVLEDERTDLAVVRAKFFWCASISQYL